MGVLDFLLEGTQPPASTTTGSTVQGLPQYVSDYVQQLLSGGMAAGMQPYQPYTGPRIAGLTPDQVGAFGQVRDQVANTPSPTAMAAPYLAQAGKTFPGAASEYMSPYIQNVTDRNAQLTERALREKLMPAVESKFGAMGHDTRSSAYRGEVDRGVRDLTEGLNAQNLAALDTGYNNAANIFSNDASRNAQLASLQGPLAQIQQQMGLTGAAALENIGATQQNQNQRSADLAYQDFTQQRDYPMQQAGALAQLLQGLQTDRTTTTSSTGPSTVSGPSPLAQAGSAATGIAGLIKLLGGNSGGGGNMTAGGIPGSGYLKRGGRIHYAGGGPLRLAYAHAA